MSRLFTMANFGCLHCRFYQLGRTMENHNFASLLKALEDEYGSVTQIELGVWAAEEGKTLTGLPPVLTAFFARDAWP